MANDEVELGAAIDDALAIAEQVTWAIDLADGPPPEDPRGGSTRASERAHPDLRKPVHLNPGSDVIIAVHRCPLLDGQWALDATPRCRRETARQ
ncbi:hypothetical protein [Nocardioides pyridinolyticus]